MTADVTPSGAVVPVEATPVETPAFYDAAGKSPAEIERDIGETRAQLGGILDELERRLAPRQILEKGVDMLKDTMSGNTGKIGEALRDNPIPLALIGAGLGWMLLSSTGGTSKLGAYGGQIGERVSGTMRGIGQRAGEIAGQVAGQVKERVSGSGGDHASAYPTRSTSEPMGGYAYARPKPAQSVGSAAGSVSGKASELTGRARDIASSGTEMVRSTAQRAGEYAQYAGDQMMSARDRFGMMVDDHPLAVGALGFLAGAAIALVLPQSRTEERWIAPMGEQLRERAESVGREALDRAEEVTGRAVDAAVDAVKEAVNEAGDAIAETAEAAKPGAKEAKPERAGEKSGRPEHAATGTGGSGSV